jgi:iron-sulfur cluster repair protein YtfE (RIC family)
LDAHQILKQFDDLRSGESLILDAGEPLQQLLHRLQNEKPRAFAWNTLEQGPDRFRVEVVRLPEEEANSIAAYLQRDHRRLDVLWEETGRRVRAAQLDEAKSRFAEFAVGLQTHIAQEETVLFPLFERATGAMGPTTVMKEEHLEILRLLDDIGAALSASDQSAFDGCGADLQAVLREHNMKEENVLYPRSDAGVGKQGAAEAIRQMQLQ